MLELVPMPQTIPQPRPRPTHLRYLATPYTVTTVLIAANTLVFLAMLASGVSPIQPTLQQVFNWGGDFFPATIAAHQYWRLFTACFVHFGIIHIGMNMYVLFLIGPFIEITFGRARYVLIYLAAGLFGSIVSVYVHPQAVGAGASGAIFGLYGAVFAFLLRNRRTLAPAATRSIGRSAGIFVLYNVVYGSMSGTTDLSAHIAGLFAGFLTGLILAPSRPAIETL